MVIGIWGLDTVCGGGSAPSECFRLVAADFTVLVPFCLTRHKISHSVVACYELPVVL